MSEERFMYQNNRIDPNIEGLQQIRRAIAAWDRYRALRRDFEEGDAYGMPTRPTVSIGDLQKLYPRAAAYLKAEQWYNSPSFKKSALGKEAMERILNEVDYKKVIDDMQNAWAAFRVAQEG